MPFPRSPRARLAVWLAAALGLALACAADEEPGSGGEAASPASAAEADEADEIAAPTPAGEAAGDDGPAPPGLPETDLPLTLLATMAAADPGRGAATVRDDQSGQVLSLHVGDEVVAGVVVAAIERGQLHLRRDDGVLERLGLPSAPVRLGEGDASWSEAPEADDPGVLRGGIQLGPGAHYVVKTPDHAWGERAVILAIQRAISAYSRRAPGGPKVHVGDVSRRGGGEFPPHLSHRSGRDVDVGYVLQGPLADETRFHVADRESLDVARSWALLRAFIDTGAVRIIFVDRGLQRRFYEHAREAGATEEELAALLQYPRGDAFPGGIIRHWKGHRNHFHVRFGPPLGGLR